MGIKLVEVKDVVFEVNALYSEYIPAWINGRPEDCYPEEGGDLEAVEFIEARIMEDTKVLPHAYGLELFQEYQEQILDDISKGFTL